VIDDDRPALRSLLDIKSPLVLDLDIKILWDHISESLETDDHFVICLLGDPREATSISGINFMMYYSIFPSSKR